MITRQDIHAIEDAAEALIRHRDLERALELWALALRLRVALNLPAEEVST